MTSYPTAQEMLDDYDGFAGSPYFMSLGENGELVHTINKEWESLRKDYGWVATPLENGRWNVRLVGVDGDYSQVAEVDPRTLKEGTPASYFFYPIFNVSDELIHKYTYRNLLASIPGLVLSRAGGSHPFQAEGTLDGISFYFRYRHGHASLHVRHDFDRDYYKPLYSASMPFNDTDENGEYTDNGFMSQDEFIYVFKELVRNLEKAAIYWQWNGVFTADVSPRQKVGDASSLGAWGHTPEEAWQRLHDTGSDQGESWKKYIEDHGLKEMVTVDDRVFPDPEPKFEVS